MLPLGGGKSPADIGILCVTPAVFTSKFALTSEMIFLTTLPEKITPVPILNLPSKPGVMPMREDFPNP
jgi:hypothetical protein